MSIDPHARPEDYETPDVGAQVAREAREEIEMSALKGALDNLINMANEVMGVAYSRNRAANRSGLRNILSAEELLAEHILEMTDDLDTHIAAIVETKAQEERRIA